MPEKITETKSMANQPQLPQVAVPAAEGQPSPPQPGLKKPELVPAKSAKKKTALPKFNWKIGVIIFAGVMFFGTMIISLIFNKSPTTGPVGQPGSPFEPTPTTVPLPSIPEFPIEDPSVYVDDPQVLQLQSTLESLLKQLDDLDLRESDLDPPVLDMEVRFE